MPAFIKGALIVSTGILLLQQFCCAEILYYSKANTTFDRTVNDLYTHEFCGFALAPRFTPTGLHVASTPDYLKRRLRTFYDRAKINMKRAEPTNDFIWRNQMENSSSSKNLLSFIPIGIDPLLKRDLEEAIRLQVEEWTGIRRLKHTATYGIREYTRGAVLKPHVDRFRTHILSAIINVRQQIDEPWPLVAFDHNYERHEIFLNETVDVVLYESATVIHGRPYPLIGDSFANIFVHFAPVGWEVAAGDNIQACIDQASLLCPEHSDVCAEPKLGHYITDHGFIIDACDHNYHRAAALQARYTNPHPPL